ncbi:mitochondrial ribonuclease P protein 1 homolog [Melitaea cinxia]|uniref:mitochondrial ribonuclease P protein 1 homolog n=1 Tax=Melitaea cinxia TaxID=113334 RepID=UPI001E273062|nr:mitochondrial ribonuclease P protein 1 homolog [Melitaea cinxia]
MNFLRSLVSHVHRPILKRNLNHKIVFQKHRVISRSYVSQTEAEDEMEKYVSQLCKGDKDLEKKFRVLMLEVEVMRQDGRFAPDHIQFDQWKHLLELPSRNQRTNYLTFLWKIERKKENQKAKKEARKMEFENSSPEDNKEYPDDLLYGIQYQSLFLRIRDQSINGFDNYRALQAMMYGQSVVIDCSYEEHMVWRETINAAKQMTFLFGDNRIHKDPFNLHMCNVNMQGEFMKQLKKNIPSICEPWFPINIHTSSYLDLFPKDKLVYLTPHCRDELTTFDPDSIYIIGCMVDKINNEPLSLAKAKRDGIKMAKLPLDRYLEWAPGSKKNLNINHMVPILLDLRLTGDWEFALRHIPRRKLMATKIMAMQRMLKDTTLGREDIFKKFQTVRKNNFLTRDEKKFKSKRTLYDDDNI